MFLNFFLLIFIDIKTVREKMRLISKSKEKIVIEIHIAEVDNDGFECLWDKIREVYDVDNYEIFNIEKDKSQALIYVELWRLCKKKEKFACKS